MKITTVGIDLAKNVFQVHGIDEHGKAVLKKQLRRDQMAAFFVNLPLTLPLFRVALNPRFTRPFYAVPRTSAARTASG